MSNPRFQQAVMFLLVSVIAAVAFFHCIRDIRDPDFFWHLKTGQWIWQHKEIPAKDPFSFPTEGLQSVREQVIMSSPWLSQIVFWLSYRAAGMNGIVLLRFLIVGSLLFVMIKRKEGDATLYAGLVLLFLSLLLKSYPVERPQVFSFFFFTLLLYLLEKIKGNVLKRRLHFLLPLLMLVWANMHAGYVAGAATIVLYIVFEGIKFSSPSLRPISKRDYKALVIAGFVGVLASFINPNTYHVFADNILFQHSYVTFNNIEFQSTVSMFRRYHDHGVVAYWVILSLAAAGLIIDRKKIDLTEAALLAATGYFSFTAVRYVAFFMLAALPVVGRICSGNRLLRPVGALILTGSLFAAFFFTRDNLTFNNLSSGIWINEQKFPVEATDFILSNNIQGNMYNYFNWGGYLIWRLAPERKVFIDGRTLYGHIYQQSDLIDNADERTFGGMTVWKSILDAYNIQYTITPVSLPLVKALRTDKDWVPVYFRHNAAIFVRDSPENREIIETYADGQRNENKN